MASAVLGTLERAIGSIAMQQASVPVASHMLQQYVGPQVPLDLLVIKNDSDFHQGKRAFLMVSYFFLRG